ncbi:MAG: aldo/keto reductase [Candidatus Schekmanbacteria bacterium]|nr:aldo/keto reductase [Candidatus Schekmanbacteria bacterium]
MEKTRLGRTNLEVTKMGLGGIALSTVMGGKDEETINKVIHAALDAGINFIDTSRVYMDSETNIGEVMKTRRKECILASKSHRRGYDEVLSDLEDSLKELQTDKIEIYQIHELEPDEISDVMKKGGTLDAFKKAKEQGLIDFIGLTSHHTDVTVEMMKTGEFDTVMFPFNVIEREPENEIVSLACSKDIGSIVMKALAGGVIRNIEKCHKFLNGYPLDNVLVGVANLAELEENLKYAESTEPLTAQELKEFEDEVAYLGKDFCRRCNYCMPCSNDIIISAMIHLTWQRVKGLSYDELSDDRKRSGNNLMLWWQACNECGQCEEKCPYDLPTIERKNDLMKLFSR